MPFLRNIFHGNIEEIRADRALRFYGIALFLTHLLTVYLWHRGLVTRLSGTDVPFCWPFFQSCYRLRPVPPLLLNELLIIYFVLTLVGIWAFRTPRRTGFAYWILLGVTFLKFVIFAQDYRAMGNYHYMIFITSAIFLLVPHKRTLMPLILVGFYVAAGSLKFNEEWLSAASLAPRTSLSPYIPRQILELSCAYVVILECVFAWFLLFANPFLFWTAFVQFIIFHIFSWHIVSYFYPCVMFCLLAIFPLMRRIPSPSGSTHFDFDKLLSLHLPKSAYLTILLFIAAQLVPRFNPGDSAITTEGRMFAMDMFDARTACTSQLVIRQPTSVMTQSPDFGKFGVILGCDPLMYYSYAKIMCHNLAASKNPNSDLDLYLVSRRTTENELRPVLQIENFCAKNLTYSILGWNDWVER